ncbi:MAG: heme lyase CcmF/NrfE family subunit [Legionella sp.]|nr:heme lyase CcmF/NrfE family subunit [Legionella sp.]
MIPEIGSFALVVALLFSIMLGTVPLLGLKFDQPKWEKAANAYALGQFMSIVLAYLCLTFCFLNDDFTVTYVLMNSSLSLPWFYKFCAVWGGHEGSMLLWVTLLSLWLLAVNFFSASLGSEIRTRALIILGWLSAGFILFLLATSNPFGRQFHFLESTGKDLNPLLQDPGFLFHPPMLYMGYVGFSVAFSLAIAVLWWGKSVSSWAKWTRPWTLAAWCCLTTGITLGSWWAYRELGWGGWWFWDPVENASFMPWLVGTALIHALMVSEKRELFHGWTILLAIMAFALSLIGTFLVRSGVVTSVHAFAVDPKRGLYILGFLCVVIGGSLMLFAMRVHRLFRPIQGKLSIYSRESFLFLNNVLLIVSMLTILLGTTYPMLIDGLGMGKLSVGAPYFNAVFIPLIVPLLILMGAGVHLKWQQDTFATLFSKLKGSLLLSPLMAWGILYFTAPAIRGEAWCGLTLAFWVLLTTTKAVINRLNATGWRFTIGQSFIGMAVAHIGIAFTVIGISISSQYGIEKDLKMSRGEVVELAGYQLQWLSDKSIKGPNYNGTQAKFLVKKMGVEKGHVIYPEKRLYNVAQMSMTESAIDVSPFRDLYVALGEPLNNSTWSVRLYYKPFVRWIWGGGLFILLGGLLCLSDRRYYQKKHVSLLENAKIKDNDAVSYP